MVGVMDPATYYVGADARTQVKLVGSGRLPGSSVCSGQVSLSVFTHNKFGSGLVFRQMGANDSNSHLILSNQKKLSPLCLIPS